MFEYRITKYDPALRSASGAYALNEWTSRSDIGYIFNGVLLTSTEYERVEASYVCTALSFLAESRVRALRIKNLEDQENLSIFSDNEIVSPEQIAKVIRAMLREEMWCKLESSRAYVHIGHDYYMYIGVPLASKKSQVYASKLGLFVERCPSPYKDSDDD